MRALIHEKEYKIKTQRDKKLEQQVENRVPRFIPKRPKQQISHRSDN